MDHLRGAKLTKRYLLSLPGGIFVMSNLVDDLMPSFFGICGFSGFGARKQWQRVVSSGCSGRLCRIFKTADQASAYLSKFIPEG